LFRCQLETLWSAEIFLLFTSKGAFNLFWFLDNLPPSPTLCVPTADSPIPLRFGTLGGFLPLNKFTFVRCHRPGYANVHASKLQMDLHYQHGLFLPLLSLLPLAVATLAFKHSVGPADKEDVSFAVTMLLARTEQTRKQIGLGSFLPTQLKGTNGGNLPTQTKAEPLLPLLRPLCSLMRDTPFCAMCPSGLR